MSRTLQCLILALLVLKSAMAAEQEVESVLEEKVIVYNWESYIPDGVLDEFTEETGIKVEYSTYDNNETMYARLKILKGRGYDIIVPSTNLVARMRNDGLLQPIDFSLLENTKDLNPSLLNKSYDPGNEFSIPYLWGTTGIAIDKNIIAKDSVTQWSDLWHKKWRGKILLTDDIREVFHIALKAKGYSTNTVNPDEIREAYNDLRKLMPNVKILSSDPRPEFESGNVSLGAIWNGEMVLAKEKRPSLEYIYPKEGASFWIDSFVIPSRASNVDNAHKFIDYMMRTEVAARTVNALGYATPVLSAIESLDQKTRDNPIIFPPQDILRNAEFQLGVNNEITKLYELLWEKLKSGKYY